MPFVVGAATLGLGDLLQDGLTSDRDLSTSHRDYGSRRSKSRTPESSIRRKLIYKSRDGRRTHVAYSPKSSGRPSSRSGRSSSQSRHHRESSCHKTHYVDVHRDSRQPSITRASSSRVNLALLTNFIVTSAHRHPGWGLLLVFMEFQVSYHSSYTVTKYPGKCRSGNDHHLLEVLL